MTDLLEVISRLEGIGGKLILDGDRIRYSVPSGDAEAQGLLIELRRHREGLRILLRQREAGDYLTRFHGQPHVKLFPFLGQKVRTPAGPGTLLQVFVDRVSVLLDSERDRACAQFLPSEIELIAEELAEAV